MHKLVYNLPKEFIEKIHTLFPQQAVSILTSMTQPQVTTFRINRLKIDAPSWRSYMAREHIHAQQVAWWSDAFILTHISQRELQEKNAYTDGWIYMQNLSSMVPVLVLDPQPGEVILDVCAAPGSKTTQIASLTGNQARIVAVEKAKPRFFRLKANCDMQGATSVECKLDDGGAFAFHHQKYFDKILLDAPCSSEGRFRAYDPPSYSYWQPRKVKEMQSKQKRLMHSAWGALKPGGVLVYSTCTFSPEENEAVIDRLIERFPGEVIVEHISLPFSNTCSGVVHTEKYSFHEDIARTRRIFPTATMEGFYVARLRKVLE